jgi:hypothetical protein
MATKNTTKVAKKNNITLEEQRGKDPYANSLAVSLGYTTTAGFPFSQGVPGTEQLSNVGTIFKSLRWYLVSNFRQVLSEAYVEIGLIQTLVDVPVDDAFRGGVEITSKQLDEDQIEDLQSALDFDDDLIEAAQAAKWNRLFGGAGIIIITDQDPSTPLDMDAIDKDTPLTFRAVDMWELYSDRQNTEGYGPNLEDEETEFYSYYGVELHHSRVLRLNGLTAPSFIRPRLRGWGFSITEKLVRSLNQYLKSNNLGYEVLDEFKLDVYKIKNLTDSLLSSDGAEKIRQRVQLANWQKNYQNAVVMDSEDDFDHKQLSFSGLAETMTGIRMQIASDMRMPLTKLFGISAAGFNSGEDDIEVYNGMVESEVRTKVKWHVITMIRIKCQKLYGFVPDDLKITFKPLRVMNSEQEENVKNGKFTRLLQAKERGEITRFEFREGCNKDKLLPITLDNAGEELNPDDPDVAGLTEGEDLEQEVPTQEGGSVSVPTPAPKGKMPPEPKTANDIVLKMFNTAQSLERALAVKTKNSAAFDRASYAADGGDGWIDKRREEFFKNPVDSGLWEKARKASQDAFGTEKWQFVVWFYKKHGGKFNV